MKRSSLLSGVKDIGEKGHSCTGSSRSGPAITAQRRSSDPLDPETTPENGLKINFSVNTEGTYGGRGAGQPSPSGVSHVEFVGLGGDRQFTSGAHQRGAGSFFKVQQH